MTAAVGHNFTHNIDCLHPTKDQHNHGHVILNNILQFQRLNPYSFDGGPYPMVVEALIMHMEKLFLVLKLIKEQKVPLTAFIFTREAEH